MSDQKEIRQTRWGEVTYTHHRVDGTYARHTYEGPREAVIVEVAQRLKSTTTMYEHMFSIEHMCPHDDSRKAACNWIRISCISSNYAGD